MTETAPAIHMYCTGNSDYKVRLGAHWQDEVLNLTVGPVETEYKILTTEGFDTPENTFIWSNNAKTMAFMSGKVLINDDANAKMTIGLTINQGDNDDEIFALKSSDVVHLITTVTEEDTFGLFQKKNAATGGLYIKGFNSAANAAGIHLLAVKGAGAGETVGCMYFQVQMSDGVDSGTSLAADDICYRFNNSGTEQLHIYGDGQMVLGNTGQKNANMTVGLTINQAGNDDEILAFKSSDVTHSYVSLMEADTYASFQKQHVGGGGLKIKTVKSTTGGNNPIMMFEAYSMEATNNAKGTTAGGFFEFFASEVSGDALDNLDASSNILVIKGQVGSAKITRWLCDEDGDTWQSGHIYVELDKGLYLDGSGPMVYAAAGSNDTWIGKNLGSARPRMEFANSLAKMYDEAEDTNMQVWAESGAITLTPTTFVRIDDLLYINELANTGMTTGITINQAGADDEILAFKANEVAHIFTDRAEADTYAIFKKVTATVGGLDIWGFRDTDGTTMRLTAMSAITEPTVPALQLRGGARDGVGNDGTTVANTYPVMLFTNWSQEMMTFYGGPQVRIGNVGGYNTKQSAGLTIDQRSYDDEILALKSSDIGHTITDLTEEDTFFAISKVSPTTGGAWLMGYNVSTYGILIEGRHSAADTTKTTSGLASVILRGSLQTGNEVGFMSADGNIVAMCNYTSTKWILNAEGDTWQSGKATIQELLFIDGGSTVDIIRDEDDMASDDAAALATQQSIKAYVNLQDGLEGVKSNEILSTSTVDELTALIPDDAYYIVISWVNASTDTINEPPILQFADAGGYETSGYVTMLSYLASASHAVTSLTNGIHLYPVAAYAADQNLSGQIILFRYSVSSQYWYCNGHCQGEGQTALVQIASRKNTTTAITSVRVTTPGGIATLDGYYSISWR
jgi:hypothetical protein